MKTLTDILEAEIFDMAKSLNAINKMVADTKDKTYWPEVEEPEVKGWPDLEEPEHGICGNCEGTGCHICRHKGEL